MNTPIDYGAHNDNADLQAVRLADAYTCSECGEGIAAGEAFGVGEHDVYCGACLVAKGIEVRA